VVPPLTVVVRIARIALENAVIFVVTTMLVFAMIRSIPGDDIDSRCQGCPEAQKAELRRLLGRDRPFVVQYADRLYATFTLDLGVSAGIENAKHVVHGTIVTIGLTGGAALLLVLVAVPIGILSGVYPRSWLWRLSNFSIYVVSMVPVFLLAYASFFVFSFTPILYDVEEIVARGRTSLGVMQLKALIFFTMIAVLAIGDGTITELIRSIREETGRILESDFIRAVRANGGSVLRHMARNLLGPVVTVLNLRILYLLGGAVVVESVYEYPGLGRLTVEAVSNRNYDLVFSITVVSVLVVLIVTTFNRILITLLDPRARD
jgi:peptide/nickel transport system permease protein